MLKKLKENPSAITTDEARRLHEHLDVTDEHSARIVSAIEALAAAHADIAKEEGDSVALSQIGHASLPTLAQDLLSAVDKNPGDVTTELLRLTQSVLSKMQKAVGNANAPHPELEAELQQEYAKIEPKVEQGTVTKAEADHLHSLEARAHGHTEKGGLTAIAQSVVAKRERQSSLSNGSNNLGASNNQDGTEDQGDFNNQGTSNGQGTSNNQVLTPEEQSHKDREDNFRKVQFAVNEKMEHEPRAVTKEDAALLESRERRAHGVMEKGSLTTETQSLADKNANLQQVEVAVRPKAEQEPDKITKEDAVLLESRDHQAHGIIEKDSLTAEVQSLADKNMNQQENQPA